MTRRFEPGELVNVHIEGVRYIGCDKGQGHGIETPDGNQWSMPWSAVIERVAPKEWPPQPADVWANDFGDRFFGVVMSESDGGPRLVRSDGRKFEPDSALDLFGPLRLLYRDGRTPDQPVPADAPDAEVGGDAEGGTR